jgi:hypothetical protein
MVQLLCFIKAFEVDSDLSLLLGLDIKLGQVLHKLDALRGLQEHSMVGCYHDTSSCDFCSLQ